MIRIESNGARALIDLLNFVVESNQSPDQEKIDKVIFTGMMSFLTSAYSEMIDFSKEEFISVLQNLANPNPISKGQIISKLEEGLRSCLYREKISLLHQNLEKISSLDFTKAE